jgi:hypothetical protein
VSGPNRSLQRTAARALLRATAAELDSFAHGSVVNLRFIGIGLVLVAGGCVSPEERLSREVRRLTGPQAEDCGRVQVGGDRAAVDGCSVRAFRDQRPFFARYDKRGIDSSLAHVIVRTPAGEMFEVSFDSDPSGGSHARPRIIPQKRSECMVAKSDNIEQLSCR